MSTKKRTAVVTGIGGGIGTTLAKILLKDSYRIIGLDLEETPAIRGLIKEEGLTSRVVTFRILVL